MFFCLVLKIPFKSIGIFDPLTPKATAPTSHSPPTFLTEKIQLHQPSFKSPTWQPQTPTAPTQQHPSPLHPPRAPVFRSTAQVPLFTIFNSRPTSPCRAKYSPGRNLPPPVPREFSSRWGKLMFSGWFFLVCCYGLFEKKSCQVIIKGHNLTTNTSLFLKTKRAEKRCCVLLLSTCEGLQFLHFGHLFRHLRKVQMVQQTTAAHELAIQTRHCLWNWCPQS